MEKRVYKIFTEEQQKAYEGLNDKQRLYVDYRAKGFSKTDAYRMAGYSTKTGRQASYLMEKNNRIIGDLVNILVNNARASSLGDIDSELNKKIDTLAKQKQNETMLRAIDGADAETAKRIKFYNDIATGKIKGSKTTIKYDCLGNVKERVVVEEDNLDVRIKARKELDRCLGLNEVVDIGEINAGDITIHIVDASNRDELADSRNQVNIDVPNQDYEVIDAEVEEEDKTLKGDFFNKLKENMSEGE